MMIMLGFSVPASPIWEKPGDSARPATPILRPPSPVLSGDSEEARLGVRGIVLSAVRPGQSECRLLVAAGEAFRSCSLLSLLTCARRALCHYRFRSAVATQRRSQPTLLAKRQHPFRLAAEPPAQLVLTRAPSRHAVRRRLAAGRSWLDPSAAASACATERPPR